MDADRWFEMPLGQFVAAREQAYFDRTVADVFGFNALQLGLPALDCLRASRMPLKLTVAPDGPVPLRAAYTDLPIASNSVDLVLLPHVLEFSADPHQILREVVRVLMPEGHLIVCGFNPWSLWGVRRWATPGRRREYPWTGSFINLPRLKDWLSLLSFDVTGGRMDCFSPPFTQERWLARVRFMEPSGDRWWPFAGGIYFLQAVKRVRGMRLITPRWSDARAARRRLVAVPHRVGANDDTFAARTGSGD